MRRKNLFLQGKNSLEIRLNFRKQDRKSAFIKAYFEAEIMTKHKHFQTSDQKHYPYKRNVLQMGRINWFTNIYFHVLLEELLAH